MKTKGIVTIFGGSGFVGRHLIGQLTKAGYRIRVAVRHPQLAGFLQPLGGLSQIEFVKANIRNEKSIIEAVEGADYVVNLVGILAQSGRQNFNSLHVQGARLIAIAAREAGVKQLVQMSALGADEKSSSKYARTKAHGEDAVLNMEPNAIIVRPSVIFGPEDGFFNLFAGMMSILPVVPVFGAKTKFQPIFVGDVASAIKAAIEGKAKQGTIYELGGPQIVSMKEVHEKIKTITGLKTWLLPLPLFIAKIIALFTWFLPNPPITSDQIKLLKKDNVVSNLAMEEHRTYSDLVETPPHSIDACVPTYLDRFETVNHGKTV